jgi:hypothetical protein
MFRAAADLHRLDVQAALGEEAAVFGDPDRQVRDRGGGAVIDAPEILCRSALTGGEQNARTNEHGQPGKLRLREAGFHGPPLSRKEFSSNDFSSKKSAQGKAYKELLQRQELAPEYQRVEEVAARSGY